MAHNLKLLFLKNNKAASDFLVKFYLHFTQKYYTVSADNRSFFYLIIRAAVGQVLLSPLFAQTTMNVGKE